MRLAISRASRSRGESPERRSRGGRQSAASSRGIGSARGQSSIRPAWPMRAARWTICTTVQRHTRLGGRLREDGIDGGEDCFGGAEGDVERHILKLAADGGKTRIEMAAHLRKRTRIGPLETENRLLHIAHGEDRALRLGGSLADEELLGQGLDHFPLGGIGVLRLVHQDMVDAAVQLEQNPGRHPGPAQQIARCQDQVFVVESALALLDLPITAKDIATQREQRARGIKQCRGLQAACQSLDSLCLLPKDFRDIWQELLNLLGSEVGEDSPLLREESSAVVVETGDSYGGTCRKPIGDSASARLVPLLGALQKCSRCLAQGGGIERRIAHARRQDGGSSFAFAQTKSDTQRGNGRRKSIMTPQQILDPAAGANDIADQIGKVLLVQLFADMAESPGELRVLLFAGFFQQFIACLQQQFAAPRFVEQLEMRDDACLDRKAAQQRLAEGMDGHDAHAPRRIEDAGEQAARQLALLVIRRAAENAVQRVGQFLFRHDGPMREILGNAVRHFGGGGIGECQA